MKLPKHLSKKPILFVLLAVPLISALGIYCFFLKPQAKTLDDFPIMVINNGQTTVYQEVKVSKSSIEKNIVVGAVSGGGQERVKIYEEIPKEVAEKASEIEFSIQPQIIEEDPIILWDVGGPETDQPVKLTYKKRMEDTQCLHPKYINEMQNVYKLDPFDFNDCSKYLHIKFLDAVYKNQKRREQEEKDNAQLIQPSDEKYKEIQKQAKKVIKVVQPKPSAFSKISAEEAIAAAKKCQFQGTSVPYLKCNATFSREDKGWRVICGQRNYKVNNYTINFHYEFYLIKEDKSCKQLNLYESTTDYNGYTFPTVGKPMWGVE